ncbi:tetrathionate reductase subunit B precursor [bacterium BMS3Abin01]|nr:tetrathionate reductase subunit B precursor [bacterium BMS3Abin01]HDZ59944.1 4Fe-4S dicluster domain-containing protein [Actinomycetota bacterium]
MSEKRISRSDLLKAGGAVALGTATAGMMPKALRGSVAMAQEQFDREGPRNVMVIDLRKCIGCRGCTVTCKSENNVPLDVWNTVVKQEELENGAFAKKVFLPRMCNHCEGTIQQSHGATYPPCVNACPRKDLGTAEWNGIEYYVGATYKRPDGAILYNSAECVACYACVKACPYGARHVDNFVTPGGPNPYNQYGIGKCIFCVQRIDNGVVPACVNTCEGRARVFGDRKDPDSEVSQLINSFDTVHLLPEENTMPQVYYIDPDNVLSTFQKGEPFRDKVD